MLTHSVVIGAHIIRDNTMLFMLRANKPFVWAPPGGHLYVNEDPITGVKREVYEESGYIIEPTHLSIYEFGDHQEEKVLAIYFLSKIVGGKLSINLSENADAGWFSLKEITRRIQLDQNILGDIVMYQYIFKLNESNLRGEFSHGS